MPQRTLARRPAPLLPSHARTADIRPTDRPPYAAAARLPLAEALGLAAAALVVEALAMWVGAVMPEVWRTLASTLASVRGDVFAPVVGALAGIGTLLATLAVAEARGLAAGLTRSPYALGIAGRDVPFLLAGLVFVTVYASLADMTQRRLAPELTLVDAAPHCRAAAILVAVLIVPLAQERFLRGALLPALRTRIGVPAAIVLAAVPGMMTATPAPLPLALALAPQLFFGWTAVTCGSLGAAAVLHAAYIAIRLALGSA